MVVPYKHLCVACLIGGNIIFSSHASYSNVVNEHITQKAVQLYLGRKSIEEQPLDLDAALEYGKKALEMYEFDEAVFAFKHVLAYSPNDLEAKSELAMLYYHKGKFQLAKPLLEQLLEQKLPYKKTYHIRQALDSINGNLNKHLITILATIEFGRQTDANFAGKSGNITIINPVNANETLIQINDETLNNAQDTNVQFATAAAHSYKIEQDLIKEARMTWNSSITYHRNEQVAVDNVDVSMVSISTGPTIDLPDYRTKISADLTHSNVSIHGNQYMRINEFNLNSDYQHTDKLSFALGLNIEDRHYINAPSIFTYTDRTGGAQQFEIGANYKLTSKNIIGGSFSYRNEDTRRSYLDNSQVNVSGNYIRLFDSGMFSKLSLGLKKTQYDDALTGAVKRHDKEKIFAFSVGKPLSDALTLSLGYQFKNIGSNIPNYDFHNHKITTNFSYKMNIDSVSFLEE